MITRNEEYPELAKALEIKSVYFKREDMHPYGSHKGRSIPVMIDKYIEKGIRHFAISSSGNAALAAAFHVHKLNEGLTDKIRLDILVGQKITKKKLHKIEPFKNEFINITMHERPVQTLFNITKDSNIKSLKQSTDDLALLGYSSLAEELLEIPDLKVIFVAASSGTTAQALAEYFESKKKKIIVHIVQTSSCHPLADSFIDDQQIDEQSIADAIVDHVAPRKERLTKLITDCNGSAWIASNEQIKAAQDITKLHTGLSISTNSALSVAGLMQAVYTGRSWSGPAVCIICGD